MKAFSLALVMCSTITELYRKDTPPPQCKDNHWIERTAFLLKPFLSWASEVLLTRISNISFQFIFHPCVYVLGIH